MPTDPYLKLQAKIDMIQAVHRIRNAYKLDENETLNLVNEALHDLKEVLVREQSHRYGQEVLMEDISLKDIKT